MRVWRVAIWAIIGVLAFGVLLIIDEAMRAGVL
jgi:hypothetical protein